MPSQSDTKERGGKVTSFAEVAAEVRPKVMSSRRSNAFLLEELNKSNHLNLWDVR